jgi:hypothetical protein
MLSLGVLDFSGVNWNSVNWCWGWLVSVVVVAVDWSGMRVVIVLWLIVGSWVGRLTSESTLNSGEVLGFFMLNFWGVYWDSIDWGWGISVS